MTSHDTAPTWEARARKVAAELSFAAWDAANPKHPTRGRPKKHRPYCVPELAQQLVDALGLRDASEREHTIKALLLHHNYLKLTNGHDV